MSIKLHLLLPLVFTAAVGSDGTEPALQWSFEGEPLLGVWQGKTGKVEAGPRPPRYPGFQAEHRAMAFSGHEGWMVVPDKERGGGVNVRFGAGETFAFEAWVKFRSIGKGTSPICSAKAARPSNDPTHPCHSKYYNHEPPLCND